MLSDGSYRICMFLQLLTDVHAQFLSFCTPSFGGQMHDINIQRITSVDSACHVENIACFLLLELRANRLCFNRMEGERRVE